MKKNILFILLLLMSITITHEAKSAEVPAKKKIYFALTSVFKSCESGSGICFIYYGTSNRTVESETTIQENKIQFKLLRSSMSDEIERELLQKTRFEIESVTVIPMDVLRTLGYTYAITIIPGYYPLQIADDYITISCEIE